jgi:hypothetical protein
MPTIPGVDLGSRSAWGLLLLAWLAVPGPPLVAQAFIGPAKCVGCHDHERPSRKWQKEEPAAFKGKAHYNTLKQLDAPKSAQWAKAVGLADAYDVKGSCVKCHATVFRGDANAGVSCESCHGGASKYIDVHQEKNSYAKSVAAGLMDLKEKPNAIAKVCVDCHVLKDAKLAAAGHPVGEKFDAGVSLEKLVHWDTKYNYAQVTAAAKTMMGGRATPSAGGSAATQPPAAGSVPPAGSTAVTPAPPPAAGTAAPATKAPAGTKASPTRASAPPPPPAPWDWDQPIAPLPDDYVPEPVSIAQDVPAAPPPPPVVARAPRRQAPAAEAAVAPAAATEPPAAEAPGAAAEPPKPPRSGAAEAVALRGESVKVLEKLLRAGTRTPDAKPPAKPELLRLQDEVIALALEALRRPE